MVKCSLFPSLQSDLYVARDAYFWSSWHHAWRMRSGPTLQKGRIVLVRTFQNSVSSVAQGGAMLEPDALI